MKDFRIGIVYADNNNRKMAGKPMLRIRHYNKSWWRSHRKDFEKFAEKYTDKFDKRNILTAYAMMNCPSVRMVE
jgi:hypothetical protein